MGINRDLCSLEKKKKKTNSPYMPFYETNHMGINRGLCSIEKIKKVWEKYKKSCDHSPKLLSVEPNILVVSWGQICDNPLVTKVWKANIV